jgi:hypothetical protein
MPRNPSRCRSRLLLLLSPLIPLGPLLGGAPLRALTAEPPRSAGGESVEVKIKIVPFCAVDAEGKPIYDLRPEDVELRIAGKAVPIESLDRPPGPAGPARPAGPGGPGGPGGRPAASPAPAGTAAPGTPGEAQRVPRSSRSVVFLFDSAFTSPAGLRAARLAAEKLLRDVPEGQSLSLWTYGAASGLERRVGSIGADAAGKARFLAALGRLAPEVNRLSTDPTEDLEEELASAGRGRAGAPGAQLNHPIDVLRATARSEYEGIARELAESLDVLAGELRRLPGPKLLLVFWQGLDPELFFEGDAGFGPASTESAAVRDSRRFSGLMTRFTAPLRAIADTGAVTVFVNPTAPQGVGTDAEGPIRQMARAAGALYAAGADPRSLEERVVAATAACYEASFSIQGRTAAARQPLEVVVKRPGARSWAPAEVTLRETWETLPAADKKRLLLDLVAGGPDAQRGPVRLSLEQLGGTVLSRPEGKSSRRLRYEAVWPAELAGRQLDVYNVALGVPARGAKAPKILRFDRQEKAIAGAVVSPLELDLQRDDSLIWGIVAVEPATGRAWFRRLQLAGAGVAARRR